MVPIFVSIISQDHSVAVILVTDFPVMVEHVQVLPWVIYTSIVVLICTFTTQILMSVHLIMVDVNTFVLTKWEVTAAHAILGITRLGGIQSNVMVLHRIPYYIHVYTHVSILFAI